MEEFDEILWDKIKVELENLMIGITYHLNKENWEKFQTNFNRFKIALQNFN